MPERRYEFAEAMRARGLPPPDAETMAGLRDIVDEGVLGASNHVALALPLVARAAAARRESARDGALALAEFIAATRGVGAPIVANALRWQVEGADSLAADEAAELLATRAEDWGRAAARRRAALIEAGVAALSDVRRPLIYDYSSTVADLVRAMAAATGLDGIVVPESRAIDGGRRYMTALADLGLPVLFLPDAALDYAVSRSDAVLLGAESVTLDGGIANTVGSTLAARAARARGVPVHGAADLFKVGDRRAAEVPAPALRRYDFLLEDGEAADTEAPELEIVPPELVTSILTEAGAVAPAALAERLAQRIA
jgi:translation initiation factor 2B subunit (eIF-2B alpha/beta/delta family)